MIVFLRSSRKDRSVHHYHEDEYFVTRHNPAKATLDYAKFVMADMILLNMETESTFSSLTGSRHISDLLAGD